MPLSHAAVVAGAIAYFSAAALGSDERVTVTGAEVDLGDGTFGVRPLSRDGPCVCVSVQGGSATWAPLTNEPRPERLQIQAAWVINGYGPLGAGATYLQDGAHKYVGPIEAFVDAAVAERPFHGGVRPVVSASGLAAIQQEIAQQNRRAATRK